MESNPIALKRIECRKGTHVGTLLATADPKLAKRVVTAWKAPMFHGATFRAFYDGDSRQGATIDLGIVDVCNLYDVAPPARAMRLQDRAQVTSKGRDAQGKKGAAKVAAPAPAKVAAPAPAKVAAPAPAKVAAPAPAKVAAPAPAKVAAPAPAKVATPAPAKGAGAKGKKGAPSVKGKRQAVYTIGYGGAAENWLEPAQVFALVAELGIVATIDTRENTGLKFPGWGKKFRELAGALYSVAPTVAAIVAQVAIARGPILLIRKEEAPGDCDLHLQVSEALRDTCDVTHIYREEYVKGPELQRAIEQDTAYECEVPIESLEAKAA